MTIVVGVDVEVERDGRFDDLSNEFGRKTIEHVGPGLRSRRGRREEKRRGVEWMRRATTGRGEEGKVGESGDEGKNREGGRDTKRVEAVGAEKVGVE